MTEKPQKNRDLTLPACLWLGLFPLLHLGSYATLTRDKWFWMLALTAVTLACFIWSLVSARRPLRFCPAHVAALGLLVCMVLSSVLSPLGFSACIPGTSARMEGLLTEGIYLLLFCCFSFASVRWKPVLFSAAAGLLGFTAVALLQRAGGNPFGLYPEGRSYAANPEFLSTVGNIDMCAGYLTVLSGLFLSGFARYRFREGYRTVSACCLAGLLISAVLLWMIRVQFGIITLALLFLATAFLSLPARRRWFFAAAVVLLALLLLFLLPVESGGLWELRETLCGRPQDSFGSNRLGVWRYTLDLCLRRPFLGGGADTFAPRFAAYLADNGLSLPAYRGTTPLPVSFDTPHNEYLALFVNHGFPALLLFGALAFLALRTPHGIPEEWKKRQRIAAAGVFCYLVQAFFSFSVCIVAPLFWVLLGLACSREES